MSGRTIIVVFTLIVVGAHVLFFAVANESRLRNVTNDVVTTR